MVSGDKTERISTFNEPACGTGALMLAQSNYCLSGVGQDVDRTLLKCALFQFYQKIGFKTPSLVAGFNSSKSVKLEIIEILRIATIQESSRFLV
ncbi:hypothetical protein Q5689_11545 [Microcoleus sp. ARI1-A2]